MYCSVKFLEPTVMVGPPPVSELPEPPTLPQATTSTNERPVSRAGTVRISLVLFFIFPPLYLDLSAAFLLRYLQPLRGERPLQCTESQLCDNGQGRDGEGSGEQDLRTAALQALDDKVTQAPCPYKRREGGARDGLYRGGPDSGEDHRRGYGQLYARRDLAPREPHAAGCVDDVLVDLS